MYRVLGGKESCMKEVDLRGSEEVEQILDVVVPIVVVEFLLVGLVLVLLRTFFILIQA